MGQEKSEISMEKVNNMPVSNPQKTVCPEKVCRGECFQLTISFDAVPECCHKTTDLVLAVDRSGSMGGEPMQKMTEAAICMTEILRKASCYCTEDESCSCYDCFCSGFRMGLLSFQDCAEVEVPLGCSAEEVKKALKALKAGGNTNHQAAFCLAGRMLKDSQAERKILVLFTDGPSNQGCPEPEALKLKASGVEIFCIGLGVNPETLERWASGPAETHVFTTCCPGGLKKLFSLGAGEICGSRIRKPEILERVAEGFRIQQIRKPVRGTVRKLDDRTVCWTMEDAGEQGPETLQLTLSVRCCGGSEGLHRVNESISYRDLCHSCLVFPNPRIEIRGSAPCPGEDCSCPIEIPGEPCEDLIMGKPAEACISGLGRIVNVSAVIKNVCPGKALGVAVYLTEVDDCGKEQDRGLKIFRIPAQEGETCKDVTLNCIRFVVPEGEETCQCGSLCRKRNFRARILANYLDTDFKCCDQEAILGE